MNTKLQLLVRWANLNLPSYFFQKVLSDNSENYYCSDELKAALAWFVDYLQHERYHEFLDNLTPVDVYLGRGEKILTIRKQKKESMLLRRKIYEQYKMRHARNTNIFLFERPLPNKGGF